MKSKRKYFVLFSCDQWKSWSSMKIVGIFTRKELEKIIKRRVKENHFEFNAKIKDINTMSVRDIDTALEYGYIAQTCINEVMD